MFDANYFEYHDVFVNVAIIIWIGLVIFIDLLSNKL